MSCSLRFALLRAICLGLALCIPLHAQEVECLPPVVLPAPTEANIFSDEQEIYLGDAIAEQIQKDYRIIEDVELTAYLARIGERLAKHLPLTKLHFQFFLVDLPDANAFVIPGGRIYVSRKLVAQSRDEDELAGVISHEMGHLVTHESAIETTRQFKEVLGVTSIGDRRDVFEKYNQLMESAARKPGAFKSRDREKGQMNADQAGFYALVKAGYDPAAMPRFWDRMTETRGKTGGWLSDLFGTTKPEERRLREMLKAMNALPASCIVKRTSTQHQEYTQWQAEVVSYSGLGHRESLHGVISKQQLVPPLRSDISHIRFSPDGRYVLAQDDSGINVLTREPFVPLFRIEAPDANHANFTPDSKTIVFYTNNLRVEYWSVAEEKMTTVKEIVLLKGCIQTELSPDGKLLACLNPKLALDIFDVSNGNLLYEKKEFYVPSYFQLFMLLFALAERTNDDGDAGFDLVEMGFSPDGRYLVAGYEGSVGFGALDAIAEAIDTTTFTKVSLPGSVKRLIAGGFTFTANDRLVGVNMKDFKKSAMVEFPSGTVISVFALRGHLSAPTRGNYLLVSPTMDFPLGVLDLATQTIAVVNKQPALDIFDDVFVAERRNGEIGLYRIEKNQLLHTAILSNFTLGRLYASEMSRDMNWLAISGRSRGAVWNLKKGSGVLNLRGFRGAYLSDDGFFFADFPKYETVERNIPKFNLTTGDAVQGPEITAKRARQLGPYLVAIKTAKPNVKENEFVSLDKNVIVEVSEASNMKSLWSKTFPKEAPRVWVAPVEGTVALRWNVADDAAKADIKADSRLNAQLARMKEKEGDYYIQVLDARTGIMLGKLLIETGKGSFRISDVWADGDWVIVTDTLNRVLVYSLSTGELKGRAFGEFAITSKTSGLLCVENESGQLVVYDLNTMEKRDQFVFSNAISMARFSEDGKKLFVLTSNQNAYVLDVSSLARASGPAR